MAEKLTMKSLKTELTELQVRLRELELEMERRLEETLEKTAERLKQHIEATAGNERPTAGSGVDTAARQRLIAETAYLIAEKRGFTGGSPEQDWIIAETIVDRMLLEGGRMPTATETAAAATQTEGEDTRPGRAES